MKEININNFNEKLYYEKLQNGFLVYMVPLKDKRSYKINLGIKYGNSYTDFEMDNKKYHTPSGVAHFLEHKLFERENGISPFEFYSKSGTSVNASTSILYTNYYCTGNNNFNENLEYLLNWIKEINITDENVEKEKGIILEEARMYKDNPDRVLYEKVRCNLFNKDPYGKIVIGSLEEIKSITREDLITCYNMFYKPSNMFLIITGDFDKESAIKIIKDNISYLPLSKVPKKVKVKEEDNVKVPNEVLKLSVTMEHIAVSYKINKKKFKMDDYNLDNYLYILLDILYGGTSKFYDENLQLGLFNSFNYNITITDTHVVITFNITAEDDKILEKIEKEFQVKIEDSDFSRIKKCLIASEVKVIDNVNTINYDIFDDVICYGEYKNKKIDDYKKLNFDELLNVKNNISFKHKSIVKIVSND